MRIAAIREFRFSLDEIFSVNVAVRPMAETLLSVLWFDLHPPIYYIQLNLWAKLGRSDWWLTSNSLAWSAAALVSLFVATRRTYGDNEALTSMLLLAVMPIALIHAQIVRMYGMLMFFAIWAWYFNHRFFEPDRKTRTLVGIVILELLLVYSHATGILIAATFAAYGLARLLTTSCQKNESRKWLSAQLLVVALGLPAVINTLIRSVSHVTVPGLREVARGSAWLVFGTHSASEIWGGAAILVLVVISFAAVLLPRTRLVAWVLIVGPITAAIAISYLIRPMWQPDSILFTAPFLALSIALMILSLRVSSTIRVALVLLAATALATISEVNAWSYEKRPNFKAAVAEMTPTQPGDVIYVPNRGRYWGIAWYLIGPYWGSVLDVRDRIDSGRMAKMFSRIDPTWRDALRIDARRQSVVYDGTPLVIGESMAEEVASQAERVFFVTVSGLDRLPAAFDGFTLMESLDYQGLWVHRLRRAGPAAGLSPLPASSTTPFPNQQPDGPSLP